MVFVQFESELRKVIVSEKKRRQQKEPTSKGVKCLRNSKGWVGYSAATPVSHSNASVMSWWVEAKMSPVLRTLIPMMENDRRREMWG